ncbi:hypothetical protein CYLTODRAFT_416311 [Cylindrobasidium torrendii FP15055 ss-10]|uniref:RNA-dependent RNA polymerase n=1 Tax=Cylindrobasidium torrendii FP15055 ss-10 TaxID=1314674 RepID=A0A0D7BU23_9AGAR|nr:hypothetical protein CYLTODRAFT_416311 [Cylindrobasidium torrendii FP15055 ss-10]
MSDNEFFDDDFDYASIGDLPHARISVGKSSQDDYKRSLRMSSTPSFLSSDETMMGDLMSEADTEMPFTPAKSKAASYHFTQSPSSSSSSSSSQSTQGPFHTPVQTNRKHKPTFTAESPSKRPKLSPGTSVKNRDEDTSVFATSQQCNGYFILSHSSQYQQWFDKYKVPHGAQFEIARLSAEKVRSLDYLFIKSIGGKSNADAIRMIEQRVAAMGVFDGEHEKNQYQKAFKAEHVATRPWAEQDKEDERMAEDTDACLGGYQESPGHNWYGGKVVYRGKMRYINGGANFKVELDKPELGPSTRITRKFGSKRILRINISFDGVQSHRRARAEELVELFKKPFVLNGRVFRAFLERDMTVFMFMTNERLANGTRPGIVVEDDLQMGLTELFEWHNPIRENMNQTAAKWASRLALGLSTSIPGPMLEVENILQVADIVSPKGSDMTDGAGLANLATLSAIQTQLNLSAMPPAVQVRIDGNKGLLVRKSSDTLEDTMKIWIRPSMTKVKRSYPSNDRAHRTIDVLRVAHNPRVGATLSVEIIINLSHNGVPLEVFKELMELSFQELKAPLTAWAKDPETTCSPQDELVKLWEEVCKKGSVGRQRVARHKVSTARLHGIEAKEDEDMEEDEDGVHLGKGSSPWWADEISGQPSTLEETVMYYLQAGFDPRTSWILAEKLKSTINATIETHKRKCKINVGKSVYAFIAPDTTGRLKPGEVFFQSSQPIPGREGYECSVVKGPVLLGRNPCKLPSDIQKWQAVDCFALRDIKDVIFISTQGSRRGADYLAGGDYDGDKALMIWENLLVDPFVNADLHFADPPEDLESYFQTENELVSDVVRRAPPGSENYIPELQTVLLNGLTNSTMVGMYSAFHATASYELGYGSSEAKRLAYMFVDILDGAKTGKRPSERTVKNDCARYNGRRPRYVVKMEKASEVTNTRSAYAERQVSEPFIMDELLVHAAKVADAHKEEVIKLCQPKQGAMPRDDDLERPWREKLEGANAGTPESASLKKDLECIKRHVDSIYEKTPITGVFTNKPISERQDILRRQSLKFMSGPKLWKDGGELSVHWSMDELSRVRASYAYVHDCQVQVDAYKPYSKRFTRFPFDVAARALCDIKAKAVGRETHLAGFMADCLKLKPLS